MPVAVGFNIDRGSSVPAPPLADDADQDFDVPNPSFFQDLLIQQRQLLENQLTQPVANLAQLLRDTELNLDTLGSSSKEEAGLGAKALQAFCALGIGVPTKEQSTKTGRQLIKDIAKQIETTQKIYEDALKAQQNTLTGNLQSAGSIVDVDRHIKKFSLDLGTSFETIKKVQLADFNSYIDNAFQQLDGKDIFSDKAKNDNNELTNQNAQNAIKAAFKIKLENAIQAAYLSHLDKMNQLFLDNLKALASDEQALLLKRTKEQYTRWQQVTEDPTIRAKETIASYFRKPCSTTVIDDTNKEAATYHFGAKPELLKINLPAGHKQTFYSLRTNGQGKYYFSDSDVKLLSKHPKLAQDAMIIQVMAVINDIALRVKDLPDEERLARLDNMKIAVSGTAEQQQYLKFLYRLELQRAFPESKRIYQNIISDVPDLPNPMEQQIQASLESDRKAQKLANSKFAKLTAFTKEHSGEIHPDVQHVAMMQKGIKPSA